MAENWAGHRQLKCPEDFAASFGKSSSAVSQWCCCRSGFELCNSVQLITRKYICYIIIQVQYYSNSVLQVKVDMLVEAKVSNTQTQDLNWASFSEDLSCMIIRWLPQTRADINFSLHRCEASSCLRNAWVLNSEMKFGQNGNQSVLFGICWVIGSANLTCLVKSEVEQQLFYSREASSALVRARCWNPHAGSTMCL